MSKKVLVTGGAGFIGSFIVDKLISEGHSVTIFDNIEPQVHGDSIPSYLNKTAKFVKGDVRNYSEFENVVGDHEVVFHEAALVGVGQSMYQVKRYVDINTTGTANLLDILVNKNHNVKKLVVASSMSCYGEGSYNCSKCGVIYPPLREESQMAAGKWELNCSSCGSQLIPEGTKESKPMESNSIYAITKKDQEEMCLNIGKTYGIPTVALRYFNVFGPRQSLSNPYTGVAAIFMSRIKNKKAPIIFEDGNQSRDFISVHDIVKANLLCMSSSAADYEVFNVGSGRHVTIKEISSIISKIYNVEDKAEVTNKFRKGDVRHCFSDISKIKSKLDFNPSVSFEEGMKELVAWSDTAKAEDKSEEATEELRKKGLL